MAARVGICAVAQTTWQRNKWGERFQGMALKVLDELREKTGVDFAKRKKGEHGIEMSISVSDDVFDARTISDNAMTDVLGAHFGCEEKVAQEGIQAVYYALAAIGSGHKDMVLVMGHCKESQSASRNMCTHVAFDPFFTRPLGLDFQAAAGLQARAYADRTGISDDQLAKVVVRARERASKNQFTPETEKVSAGEVAASQLIADPVRELHAYPVSDGAVGMILATEEVAKKICDKPVWVTGVGNCMDRFFLGDRDLSGSFAIKNAAERACKRAGISDPKKAFDVIEVSDQYAYQLPMWMEGLGLIDENGGPAWVDSDGADKMNVNSTGGMLAGNPMMLGGLVRAAEAARQLMGECGELQVDGAKTALAHGVMGPAGQFHSVATLATD